MTSRTLNFILQTTILFSGEFQNETKFMQNSQPVQTMWLRCNSKIHIHTCSYAWCLIHTPLKKFFVFLFLESAQIKVLISRAHTSCRPSVICQKKTTWHREPTVNLREVLYSVHATNNFKTKCISEMLKKCRRTNTPAALSNLHSFIADFSNWGKLENTHLKIEFAGFEIYLIINLHKH